MAVTIERKPTPELRANMERALDLEARGWAQDLFTVPAMMARLLQASPEEANRAIDAIRDMLRQMWNARHIRFTCVAHPDSGAFVGYACTYEPPKVDGVTLQKIWIAPEFRGIGAGSDLMRVMLGRYPVMSLVCMPELIPFYERFGFVMGGHYHAHKGRHAPKSAAIYAGGVLMFRSNKNEIDGALMLFSDDDLRDILKAMDPPAGSIIA